MPFFKNPNTYVPSYGSDHSKQVPPEDLMQETSVSALPGGDSVSLHWHPADFPLQQLARWEESRWTDREAALWDGIPEEEAAEK